jgi:CBS domain containing-hemolysin-like protein
MDTTHLLLYIVGCIILIGFFAGIEIAFISVSKLNIELRKKQGTLTGKILSRFMEEPEEFIGSSLIGVNITLVIYGLLMTNLTDPYLNLLPSPLNSEYVHLFLDTLIATVIILLFAEFIPKAVFRAKAEQALVIFSIPMKVAYVILSPLAKVFVAISEFILKYLFNVRIKENQKIFNRIDLEVFVKQSIHGHETDNAEVNAELFENALDLVNVKIRKCQIPRNEVVAVDVRTPIADVKKKFIETKLSKIVVYDNTIDNVIGYLHHLDLNRHPTNIREVLHKISAIPETMSAVDLMNRFTKERRSIAWVIDEFGCTAGIVTMEDVLEEIFGDINDEYDVQEYIEKQLAEYEYIFSGRIELDYLNEKYDFNLPTDEFETLSGYIISQHETIPKQNESIIIDNFEFSVLSVSNTRIETVKMKILK